MQESYTPGQLAIGGALSGTEQIAVDNGGAVHVTVTAQQIANLGPAGNLSGPITTTGNITGGNLSTSGKLAVTGNATTGNLSTTNITVGNVTAASLPSADPHVAGRLFTGNVSGNITVLVSQG
jgi:hypothetical protein